MNVLAAVAGALVAVGLVLLAAELTRRAPAPGTPPSVLRARLPAGSGRRVLLAVVAGLGVLLITRWPVAGLSAAAAALFLPRLMSGSQQRRRTAALEALEQWARRLADMLTASRGLEDALEASARTAPAEIAGPVGALARRLSARASTETALRAFAAEIDDPAGDRIAAALIIATKRRGAGAHDVLRSLAEMLARDVAGRRDIEAERAQHRTTVRWIVVFVVIFTVIAVVNRHYSAPYGTVAGQVVLAMVAGLYAFGLTWLHRLGNIPAPGRFLDPPAEPDQAGWPGPAPARAGRRPGPGREAAMTLSGWVVAAGLLAGLGLWLLLRELLPSAPRLDAAVNRLDAPATAAPVTAAPADGGGRRAGLAARIGAALPWLPSPGPDLALLGQDRESFLASKITCGFAGLATVPVLSALLLAAGHRLPLAVPVLASLVLGGALFLAPDLVTKINAAEKRADFRHALTSYLDLVALERGAGSAPTEALEAAAALGGGWAFQRIAAALDAARRAGRAPWSGLADLAAETGVPELADLADIAGVAGQEGARIIDTLTARAASMRAAALSADRAVSGSRSTTMVIPIALLGRGLPAADRVPRRVPDARGGIASRRPA